MTGRSNAPGRGNLASWQHQQQRVEESSAELICSLREAARKIGRRLSRISRVRQAIPGDEHNQYHGSDCRDVSERTQGKAAADKAQQYGHERECAPHNPYDQFMLPPQSGRFRDRYRESCGYA